MKLFRYTLFILVCWLSVPSVGLAAGGFVNSNLVPVGGICPIINTPVTISQNDVGFYADPAVPTPKTGEVIYVRASSTNISGCVNDTVGFEFFFPANTALAIDATNKVLCYARNISTGAVSNVQNGPNGACSQTPSLGSHGGQYFGWSVLPSGWQLEIRVPVRFNQELLGLAGPSSHQLSVFTTTAWGNATTSVAVTSFYSPNWDAMQNNNVTSTSAKISANIYTYFKSGNAFLDYDTTQAFNNPINVGGVSDTTIGINAFTDLTNLTPSTTYYWRARFVTASGTFTSPTQSFNTNAGSSTTLDIVKSGNGTGTVSSSPAGIDCGATCSASFATGATVTLTAAPNAISSFAGWSGACTGTTPTCTVTMNAAKSVNAQFARATGALSLGVNGLPNGTSATLTITDPDSRVFTETLLSRTGITLNDVPTGNYTVQAPSVVVGGVTYIPNFASQTVTVTAVGSSSVQVVYSASLQSLTVSENGTGFGNVDTSPTGASCLAPCTAAFASGTTLTLTASPKPGSSFAGWGGACSGTGICTVTMNAAQSVTATFDLLSANSTLSINFRGTGTGSVSGSEKNLTCNKTGCTGTFPTNTVITLTAKPNADSSFAGWGGFPGCKDTLFTCDVTMDANKTLDVGFDLVQTPTFALNITKNGTGTGSVSSNPAGINCGATCSTNFNDGSSVTLTATSANGSVFAGWGGACSGTGACTVTMNAIQAVTATFNTAPANTFALTISKAGTGAGSVSSNPAGITCGATCTASFNSGSSVTLSATPVSGSSFAGWSGACTGTTTCVVTMDAIKNATATFTLISSSIAPDPAQNSPTDRVIAKGSINNPALAFAVTLPGGQLSSITLSVSGTGNDLADLTSVKLYNDANANGLVDASEVLVAQGKFNADNGTLTLTPTTAAALSASGATQFLVVADINSSLAVMRVVPVLGGLFLLGLGMRRRRWLGVFGIALMLSSCGTAPVAPITQTYQFKLEGVNITSSGKPITVTGLPLTGATLSVEK